MQGEKKRLVGGLGELLGVAWGGLGGGLGGLVGSGGVLGVSLSGVGEVLKDLGGS